jgi:hypothetical protein
MGQKNITFDYNVIFCEKKLIIIYIMGHIWYQNLNFTWDHFLNTWKSSKKSLIIHQYKKATCLM